MGSLLSTFQTEPAWRAEAHFAMESSCFCVVCGSPFGLFGEIHSFDTEVEHYQVNRVLSRYWIVTNSVQWMRIHRLIGSRHDIHHHNIADLSEDDFQYVSWRMVRARNDPQTVLLVTTPQTAQMSFFL